jgi:hypothetical protein
MYNLKGEIKSIKETQQVSDKFKKREFSLLDESGQYPQVIAFQLSQDKCDLIDPMKVGDMVDLSFNLRGREWENSQGEIKVFNTLDVWKINSQTPDAIKQEETGGDNLPF